MNVELTEKEVGLLLQSLTHCLATCKNHDKAQPCEDCDAATTLKNKLLSKQTAVKEK